jgi:hypothetical protein
VRRELEIAGDDIVVTYTGSVHATNLEDMRALYTAVAKLRSTGLPIVLVKTGIDAPVARSLPRLGAGIRALGRVPRSRVAELVAAADILVQPGRPGPFDDFRFPSKLPDFLVSGRPVVLPRANIGLALEDGVEALLLEHGDADEIAAAVRRLAEDVELRTRLGAAGRAFAERTLSWADAGRRVADMYVEAGAIGSPMRLELPTGDPRIDLVERHVTGQEGDYRERMLVSLAADADGAVPAAPHGDTDVYRTWVRKRCLYALVTGASVVHVASAHEAVAAVSDAARSFDASRTGRA